MKLHLEHLKTFLYYFVLNTFIKNNSKHIYIKKDNAPPPNFVGTIIAHDRSVFCSISFQNFFFCLIVYDLLPFPSPRMKGSIFNYLTLI